MIWVESRLSAIFCAVPAVIRVEPARNSAPVSSSTGISAWSRSGVPGLLARPIVSAPAARARRCCRAGERGPARGSDRHDHVRVVERQRLDRRHRRLCVVLRALDRPHERRLAARDQVVQTLARPAEGRMQLDAVLDREAPRGAGAGIDQATTPLQARRRRFGRAGERRQRVPDRDERRHLAVQHRRERLLRRPGVGVAIAIEPVLGIHGRLQATAA